MTRDADVDYSGTVVQSTTGWDNGRTRKAKLNEELNELSAEDLRSSPVRLSALACRFRPRLPSRMSDWLGPIGNLRGWGERWLSDGSSFTLDMLPLLT